MRLLKLLLLRDVRGVITAPVITNAGAVVSSLLRERNIMSTATPAALGRGKIIARPASTVSSSAEQEAGAGA